MELAPNATDDEVPKGEPNALEAARALLACGFAWRLLMMEEGRGTRGKKGEKRGNEGRIIVHESLLWSESEMCRGLMTAPKQKGGRRRWGAPWSCAYLLWTSAE